MESDIENEEEYADDEEELEEEDFQEEDLEDNYQRPTTHIKEDALQFQL